MKGIKQFIKEMPIINKYFIGKRLFLYYQNENREKKETDFIKEHFWNFKRIGPEVSKFAQILKLIKKVNYYPIMGSSFFYSIDPYIKVVVKNQILDNYSIDYSWVVDSSLSELLNSVKDNKGRKADYGEIINSLQEYVNRAKKAKLVNNEFHSNFEEILSLFTRPAEHFHEAIQRILFVNQWLWQTGHKHNGFGHLDWILYDLYKHDIDSCYIKKTDAKNYLIDFFKVLHDKCWFKSTILLGDTGQVVILGGQREDGHYYCNDLTYLFIEVSKELKLPDPKVLLRVSIKMPAELLTLAMECISTGIGAPLLSNDDAVIPSLIQFGYAKNDAYNYATSACWEPLTIGKSCDQNNIRTVNFCEPFVQFLESDEFEKCQSIEDVKFGCYKSIARYLDNFLSVNLDNKEFEEDPLLTLFSPEILKTGKDVVRGGAKYANLGLTSVGMSTVVNSLLNLQKLVFDGRQYSLHELNKIRKQNFEGNEDVRQLLNRSDEAFGMDSEAVVSLTNDIMYRISDTLEKHQTKLGGKYKYGLSSPNYIVDSKNIGATFDGRKAGEPFGVHISGKNGLPPTELISFASHLDYKDNRINGNVVDFIMSPMFIKNNIDKAVALIKGGIKQGFYQLQINVVDSATLIEAQKHPDMFSKLIVRVWGFSAYFKDLPKEYQDYLIRRSREAEMVAKTCSDGRFI